METLIKQTIKGYEFREQVGEGGFGAVYRAFQPSVGREVAIKVILPQHANQPEFIRRFESEAQYVAHLEHPHIVPLYDYWRDPDGAFLVMRWLRGGSLRQSLEHNPWSLEKTAVLLDQLTGALAIAHREGIIHRDIKPDNILLDEDENAYLADFGIAKDVHIRDLANTAAGDLIGSPAYISPEQIRQREITPRTDLYSLGYVLYEVLTGKKPFGDATTAGDYIEKHLSAPLPMLSIQDSRIPAAVDEVLQTATAKDPTHRYPSAQRFAAAFRAAMPSRQPRRVEQPLADPLTERELEVLKLMMDGLTSKQVAERLVIAVSSVRWYDRQIYSKLDVHSRQQAIDRATSLRLLDRPQIGRLPSPDSLIIAPHSDYLPTLKGSEDAPLNVDNPYKGLRAFQEADASDFFGRASLTERLLSRLSEGGDAARFLLLVGPSGSGKSSVVRAGLIPALRKGEVTSAPRPFVADLMPGTNPLEELEAALLRVAVQPLPGLLDQLREDRRGLVRAAKRLLPNDNITELILVVDQFEETFTLVQDEAIRVHFIDNLLAAAADPRGRIRVILTIRADFYDRPLMYPRLAEMMRTNTEIITPLSAREMEQSIIAPAERVGLRVEPGLVATILKDVGEQPGTLPLLQFALTELFERREGLTLTVDGYRATGGVLGALARRATEIYTSLDANGQNLTRQMFLRLVTLGEGTEDTRRRALMSEINALDTNGGMEDVIDAFAGYRLLTLDRDPISHSPTVEIAHEALIREWTKLREWLADSREDIRVQRRLATAAAEWNSGRDSSYLAYGSRLTQFETWITDTSMALTQEEREYLQASLADRARSERIERERQAHEQKLEKRSRNVLRTLVIVLLAATLGAFGLTAAAMSESDRAERNAMLAESSFQRSEAQRIASESKGVQLENAGNEVAALLAIRSLNLLYTPQGDAALGSTALLDYPIQQFVGHTDRVKAVDFSPDGLTVLTGSGDNSVRLWDSVTGQESRQFTGDMQDINSAMFSPDGSMVLTGSRYDHTVRLWDIETGEELRRFDEGNSGRFSLDGTRIFVYSEDTTASSMIDLETGDVLHTIPEPQIARRPEVSAYSPDGTLYLDALPDDPMMHIRRVDTNAEILVFASPENYTGSTFSQDNRFFLLANGDGNTLVVWDLNSGELLYTLVGHSEGILSMAISADNSLVVTGGNDRTVRVWNMATGQEIRRFSGHTQAVRVVAISSDNHFVISGGFDQKALLWEMSPSGTVDFGVENQGVWASALSPNRDQIAVGTNDGRVVLWDADTGEVLHVIQVDAESVSGIRFSPDGSRLVTASPPGDTEIHIWDVASGELLQRLEAGTIRDFTLSWDSASILTAMDTLQQPHSTVMRWDMDTGEQIEQFTTGSTADFIAESPDGSMLFIYDFAEQSVSLLDTVTGAERHSFAVSSRRRPIAYDFSPDSRLLFVASNETGQLWDLESGTLVHVFTGHRDNLQYGAFSHDGQRIVTVGDDHTIRLWNTATGAETRRMSVPYVPASAEFTADERQLIVMGDDERIHLIDAQIETAISALCSRLLRDFTPEERTQYEIHDEAATCI